jgi:hypothetical protein
MMEGCNGAEGERGGGDIVKKEEEVERRATDTDMWTVAEMWGLGSGDGTEVSSVRLATVLGPGP